MLSLPKVGCVFSQSHTATFWFTTLVPILVLAALYGVHKHQPERMGRETLFKSVVAVLFAVYPRVSAVVVATWICDEMADGNEYLQADLSIQCDAGYKLGYFFMAFVFFVVYSLGTPFLFYKVCASTPPRNPSAQPSVKLRALGSLAYC